MPLFAVVFKRKTKACTVGRPYTSRVRVLISAWPVVTVMVSSSALVFFWCLEHGFGGHPPLKRGLHLQRQDWRVEVPWAGTVYSCDDLTTLVPTFLLVLGFLLARVEWQHPLYWKPPLHRAASCFHSFMVFVCFLQVDLHPLAQSLTSDLHSAGFT